MLATRKTAFNCIGCPCAPYTVVGGTVRVVSNYTYDGKSRVTEYACGMASTSAGNRTTTQISGYTAKVNGTAVDSYSYTYDSLGNITVVNRSGNLPIYYTYDPQIFCDTASYFFDYAAFARKYLEVITSP